MTQRFPEDDVPTLSLFHSPARFDIRDYRNPRPEDMANDMLWGLLHAIILKGVHVGNISKHTKIKRKRLISIFTEGTGDPNLRELAIIAHHLGLEIDFKMNRKPR